MRGIHRRKLTTLVAAAVLALPAGALAQASASASTAPVRLNYACASKTTGQLSYASTLAQCGTSQTRVKIYPGPVYLCVHWNRSVYQVAALGDCPSTQRLALTLPPSSGRVYFCATTGTGVLRFARPAACTATEFPVVSTPHRPPALANVETSALQYDAGTPAVPVTSSLTVSSPDATMLAGATVSIGAGFTASEDSLGFASQNGITGSYASGTGVLTLTGTSSLASYQAALRSVTYRDSNGSAPSTGTRTISFQVRDPRPQNDLSNVVARTVNVNPNSPPVAGDVTASTDKNTAIDINVLASASDPDGDTLTLTSVDGSGTKGSVSINPDSTVHYDPNGQFQGLAAGQSATDTFTYTVSDGYSSATGTVTVTVNGLNDAPVISNIESSPVSYHAQDPAAQVTASLTISDDDDATISGATASITSGFSQSSDALIFTSGNGITGSYDTTHGVLTLTGNASISAYEAALQSVQFYTSDGATSPAARVISFTVTDSLGATSAVSATRTIDVIEANQPPVAVSHTYTAVGNTPLGVGTSPSGPAATVSGSLLSGDSDPDSGGAISVTGNTSTANGTVTVNPNGTFTYVPNRGFTGTDSFQYTITDSDDPANPKTATASVTITVGPLVWYADNSKAAGNGTAGSPFSTLAAATSAAGTNSIIFLYQGSGTYTGGVTMHSGEDLVGQPYGLTADGYSVVPAGGSAPTITNSSGDGIDLASNVAIEGVTVSGASATGINGSGVTGNVTIADSTVTGSGVNNAAITDSGGNLNLAVTGSTFSSTNPSSPQGYGLIVNPNGSTNATVSVTGSTFTNNSDLDFYLTTDTAASGTNSVTFSGNQVTGGGGVELNPGGTSKTAITIDGNNIQKPRDNGIGIDNGTQSTTAATVTGTINGNTVGSPTVSDSGGGNSIGLFAEGSGAETIAVTNNNLYQYDDFAGIYYIDREGGPTMNLTITGNTLADPGGNATTLGGAWGILGEGGALNTDNGTLCAAITGNTVAGSGQPDLGSPDVELDQTGLVTYELPGYSGAKYDANAVQNLVAGNNSSGGTPGVLVTTNSTGPGFTGGSACAAP